MHVLRNGQANANEMVAEHAHQEALAAASVGDQDAFKRLTDPYLGEIHLHCYRMLGSFHDAQDAVQETLLRTWKHLGSLQDPGSFRA